MKEVRRAVWVLPSVRRFRGSFAALMALGFVALLLAPGCATKGDFRKLEERVLDQSRKNKAQPDPFERIAALSAEIESLRQEQKRMAGELEVTQKKADDALAEAQKARQAEVSKVDTAGQAASAASAAAGETAAEAATSKELVAYQEALQAWRSDEKQACIDGFREFLKDFR